ncbi:MAG: tetratricopeptide repeat protein [Nitrospiria bacterium]
MKRLVLLLILSILPGGGVLHTERSALAGTVTDNQGEPEQMKEGYLSEQTYKALEAIHKLMDEMKLNEALDQINRLLPSLHENPYASVLVHQTRGYLYVNMERYKKAIPSFEKVLALNSLSEEQTERTRYDLAQLYMSTEQHAKGVETIEIWLRQTMNPPPDAHVLAANAYFHLERFRKAIPHLRRAIADAASPKEEWYQLLLANYHELSEEREMAKVLEEIIRHFPEEPTYWKQLSVIYMALDEVPEALATLELAHTKDLLEEEEIISLAKLYLYLDIPYKAGLLLEAEMKDGSVKATEENWKLLSDTWLQAKELDLALTPLQNAADLSNDGQLDLQRGEMLVNLGRWEEAIMALEAGLSKGENQGRIHILLGISHFENGELAESLSSFHLAANDIKTGRSAEQWMQHVQTEIKMQ